VVKIRLQKLGRRNRSYFRIVVTDVRVKRQGLYLEKLGQYDPVEENAEKQLTINTERAQHWISEGAQPTHAVISLLAKKGVKMPVKVHKPKAKKPAAPAK
jgi:small subunit ribosomal protein S16